jgi:hypothetical protein
MRKALLAGLFLSGSLFGASNAAALAYCGNSGSFGACASAGLAAGHDASGPAVGLRNLAGLAGDAGYVLAGFAMYYVGTRYAFGDGGPQEGGSGGSSSAAGPSLSLGASGSAGRGSRLAPLRSEKGSKAPRSVENPGKGNGPINYTLSLEGGKGGNVQPPADDFVPSAQPSGPDLGSPGLTPTLSTTAPEPVTMALTAIGLIGLAGAGYVRRLRQS